jgi:hypothetical protein
MHQVIPGRVLWKLIYHAVGFLLDTYAFHIALLFEILDSSILGQFQVDVQSL